MESVISASLIVLVIRSRRPFFKSSPGKYLLTATLVIVGVTLMFPFSPFAHLFGFRPLPALFILAMGAIVLAYIVAAEIIKKSFFRKVKF